MHFDTNSQNSFATASSSLVNFLVLVIPNRCSVASEIPFNVNAFVERLEIVVFSSSTLSLKISTSLMLNQL